MWNVLLLVPATVPAPWDARRASEARALSHSLALGSLLIATCFLALGGALSRLPAPSVPTMPTFDPRGYRVFTPPPLIRQAPAPPAASGAATIDPHAKLRPVVVDEVPIDLEPVVSGPPDGERGGSHDGRETRPLVEPLPDAPPVDERPDVHFVPDEDPVPIFAPKPVYPDLALQAQVEGTVVVRALVRRDGRVGETRIERGVPLLNDAAVAAVSRWTFAPARTNHVAVACWVVVPVRFRLHDAR